MKNSLGDLEKLRKMVFEFMLSRELHKNEMAERLGISYKTFKGFMSGDRDPRFKSLSKIINFFKSQNEMYDDVKWDKEGNA